MVPPSLAGVARLGYVLFESSQSEIKKLMDRRMNERMNAWASDYLCKQHMNMAMGTCACGRVCGCAGEAMGGLLGERKEKRVHR